MLTKHFHLTQVCILPLSNIERGNGGVDTYSVDITIVISCFWHFPTQFVQDCSSGGLVICDVTGLLKMISKMGQGLWAITEK